ncbi:MAG: hypothetical protein U0Y10_24360 [Spirosomataceae bacterium]
MNKMLKIILIALAVFLVLGYFFVQWANRPDNVEALLKKREEDRKQAVADSLKAIQQKKQQEAEAQVAAQHEAEIQRKTETDLRLWIDETFANNRLMMLEDQQANSVKLKDNALTFSTLVYKKSSYGYAIALSKEEVDNFVAEAEVEISGDELSMGIVFNHHKTGKKDFAGHEYTAGDYVYSGLQYLNVNLDGDASNKRLISLKEMLTFKSVPKQLIRVEKKGKHLTVSINGQKMWEDQNATYSAAKGKIGLYIRTANSGDWNESVIGTFKRFRVWKWD